METETLDQSVKESNRKLKFSSDDLREKKLEVVHSEENSCEWREGSRGWKWAHLFTSTILATNVSG